MFKLNTHEEKVSIDLSLFQPGVYYVTQMGRKSGKLVVIKD